MSEELEIRNIDQQTEWDDLMARCVLTDLQQTWEYGEGVRACIGWEPVRQVILKQERPVAMAQTLFREIPMLGPVARIQHGPLFIQRGEVFQPFSAVEAMSLLCRYWTKERNARLHLTPCLAAPDFLPGGWAADMGLRPSAETLWQSIRVDLMQTEKKLRGNMKRRWRQPVEKAEKAGLQIETDNTDTGFDFFLEKYHEAAVRKGFSWPSPELVRAIRNAAPGKLRLAFAVKDSRRLSGIVFHRYADTQFCLVAWNDPESEKFHAHNFLIWKAILSAQAGGARWFDLGGIDPENLPGITLFKQGVGGEEYRLIGNFEGVSSAQADDSNYRKGLGHILSGLDLPEPEGQAGIEGQIMEFIAEFVRRIHGAGVELSPDLPLVDGGLIDSLSLVTLVQQIQESFGITIGVQDITVENFNTIHAISRFVQSRTGG